MRTRHLIRPILMAATLVSISVLTACGTKPSVTLIEGQTMGTTYSIKVVDAVDTTKLAAEVEKRLVEINQLMSTYIPDSEISKLNTLQPGESMMLSRENQEMLRLANELNVQSAGKFDVTLGPLIRLWGFGADPSQTRVPPQAKIQAALSQMGMDALMIKEAMVVKQRPVEVDFSSIAKGYGVDELARLVEEAGATHYLVEIGGELRASGLNERQLVWRIGVEVPDLTRRAPITALPLKNLAMATSGDYRNYFEVEGKRFSHTIDPSTGFPITHDVASVTVLAPTAAVADGYATAINVMGLENGNAIGREA